MTTIEIPNSELLDDIDATLISLLAVAYFGPAEQGTSESVRQACAAEVLLYRLRMARKAVAELRAALELPARLPMDARPRASAAPMGEPGLNLRLTPGEEPTPGSAVAAVVGHATRESERADISRAGASSGRDRRAAQCGPRPDGGAPGDQQLPAAAPNVPGLVVPRDDGSADGAVGAATKTRTDRPVHYGPIGSFSLPSTPAVPSFDNRPKFTEGRHRLIGEVFQVGTATYATRP